MQVLTKLKKRLCAFKTAISAQNKPSEMSNANKYSALNAGVFLVPYY
ncbi:hypothetical protein SAMN02745127_02281 [Oceanospirillum multiglobuliferum]|nr:hypothetical protein SAMN02745127_02281 [Oceanospirillum multiglobuliferum]